MILTLKLYLFQKHLQINYVENISISNLKSKLVLLLLLQLLQMCRNFSHSPILEGWQWSTDGHFPVVVGRTRSNGSKDNLCDLPISTIPTNPTNPTSPTNPKISKSQYPNIQLSKYPNIQTLPTKPNWPNQIKPTKPNWPNQTKPNQTDQTKPTKPNRPKQSKSNKLNRNKPNWPNKTKQFNQFWYRSWV